MCPLCISHILIKRYPPNAYFYAHGRIFRLNHKETESATHMQKQVFVMLHIYK